MVFKGPTRPAQPRRIGPGFDGTAHERWRQLVGVEEIEAIGTVQPAIAAGESFHFDFGLGAANLGNGKCAAIFVGQRPQPFEKERDVGVRLVIDMQLKIERSSAPRIGGRRRRIVTQFGVVHGKIDGIDAEAIDPPIEPETSGIE